MTKESEVVPLPAIWFMTFLATLFFPVTIVASLYMWLRALPRARRRRRAVARLRLLRNSIEQHDVAQAEYWAGECLELMLGESPTENQVARVFSDIPF